MVDVDDKNDVASVLLYHVGGNPSELELVWYNFPEPVWGKLGGRLPKKGGAR